MIRDIMLRDQYYYGMRNCYVMRYVTSVYICYGGGGLKSVEVHTKEWIC